jgi:CubicO group peptidase (beta-lactamase class C family)
LVPNLQDIPSDGFHAAASILAHAVATRNFPAAVIEVGNPTTPLWRRAFGRLHFEADAPPTVADTIFDLASLTKVLATTALAMQQIERGVIDLDDRVGGHIAAWRGADREQVTIRDLLAHCGGLADHAPLYRDYEPIPSPASGLYRPAHATDNVPLTHAQMRDRFEAAICHLPLDYAPRTKSIYSDLGFMLLGFMLEGDTGLASRTDTLRTQMGGVEDLQFGPPTTWLPRTAPTEVDPWRGRPLVGEVHDENAAALQGAAGHAGLFGTAAACGEHARHLLQVLDGRVGAFGRATLESFITRISDVPRSSRALGWDTMLPTSSCGSRMSNRSFGHTGFTGTSLWIDPERGVYVVLLTNRVHPTRANNAIRHVRPAVHNAVMNALVA